MIFSGVNISGMSATGPVIVTGDPYYANVALLLHADGTNGSTTFIDNSPVPKTVTAFADAQISTSVFKYGTGSAKFDGTGDYLTVLSPLFAVGTGDFTVEGWVYLTAYSNGGIFSTWTVGMDQGIWLGFDSAGKINFYIGGAYNTPYNNGIISTETMPLNTWTYIAAVRVSSAMYLYLNGVRIGTTTCTRNIANTSGVVGRVYWGYDGNYLNGYIDDVRVTCGVARYGAADFTPPTAPFPNS